MFFRESPRSRGLFHQVRRELFVTREFSSRLRSFGLTSSLQNKEHSAINSKEPGEKPPAKKHLKIQFLFFPGCPNHNAAWRELTENWRQS